MATITEANRAYFDKQASEYDAQPWQKTMNSMISRNIQDRRDWLGLKENAEKKEVRFLDYACGSGQVSRALWPRITASRGIDLAPNMVQVFNSHAESTGLTPEQMTAVQGDLLANDPESHLSDPSLFNFDFAAVGLGFHHFDDVLEATKRLSARLKPGGVFFVVDFVSDHEKEIPHAFKGIITINGFNESGMRTLFEEAGLVEFGFSIFDEQAEMYYGGVKRCKTVFMAKGTKPLQ
ncbi:S-adenosyl-L-methionine-dependent methyltransferase [Phyllosticta citriasiana]|uniref:S-adenosyl-L-methionine-dependent methyltransferase n=1 Tax=Phyllosticta citriasiana TaxID=595635 RepID=A0ABR1KFD0_9PEZI